MSFIKTAIGSAAISIALLSGAAAQNPEPWDLREKMAYVVTPSGKTMTMQLNERSVSLLMRTAKRVPNGTAFIMSNGQLYTINAAKR